MPWLIVNQTRLTGDSAVPTPDLALDVQRGAMPGQPGASVISTSRSQAVILARDAKCGSIYEVISSSSRRLLKISYVSRRAGAVPVFEVSLASQ